jgi:hypothetical protein
MYSILLSLYALFPSILWLFECGSVGKSEVFSKISSFRVGMVRIDAPRMRVRREQADVKDVRDVGCGHRRSVFEVKR